MDNWRFNYIYHDGPAVRNPGISRCENELREVAARGRLRTCLFRGVAGIAFGFGFFFSIFLIVLLLPNANPHALWTLIIPLMGIIYGVSNCQKVDNYLKKT